MIKEYLYGHNSADTAYVVDDYPYGFRLRTKIRYWIETTKNGDRFVSQTLNPKTGLWNKEKKSTYVEVGVMLLNEESHVKWTTFSHWEDEEKLDKWLENIDQSRFNDQQVDQIKQLRAIFRVRKNVTVTVTAKPFRSQEEEEAYNKKQKEIKNNINRAVAVEYLKQK